MFSAVVLWFTRVFIGVERGKKSLVFWVDFVGFYLNHKGMEDQGSVLKHSGSVPKTLAFGAVCVCVPKHSLLKRVL